MSIQIQDYLLRETEGGYCIEKYMGNDGIVEIPDRIGSISVVEVGDYAFSGMDFIREVEICDSIIGIGDHCFYDSRKLRRVSLTDHVKHMGDGAFKNCESLSEIELFCSEGRDTCIRDILSECWQEILVRIQYRTSKAVLVFPEYGEEFFENCSTVPHLFYTEIYGSGLAYRQCLQGGSISYRDYDRLLEKSAREDRGPVTAGIAMNRLKYPLSLDEERREACRTHLREHAADAVRWSLEREEESWITFLMQESVFNSENLGECIQVAQDADDPAVIAALLSHDRKKTESVGRGRYQL